MKNKTVNKKILRAMSIGLAAMMTVDCFVGTEDFVDDEWKREFHRSLAV